MFELFRPFLHHPIGLLPVFVAPVLTEQWGAGA